MTFLMNLKKIRVLPLQHQTDLRLSNYGYVTYMFSYLSDQHVKSEWSVGQQYNYMYVIYLFLCQTFFTMLWLCLHWRNEVVGGTMYVYIFFIVMAQTTDSHIHTYVMFTLYLETVLWPSSCEVSPSVHTCSFLFNMAFF